MIDGTDTRVEWSTHETKAASITQERRSEELQLERLILRLHDKLRDAARQEPTQTAA
jgi:hypothetical protein